MTLPYEDSPYVDENIAESIANIKSNLDYLDGYIGTGNVKCLQSIAVELSTRTGSQLITGVGFQPKAMIAIATGRNSPANSWGAATQYSTGTSVDCACVCQDASYAGGASYVEFMNFYQTSTSYIVGSVSTFTSDGAAVRWTKTNDPGGLVADFLFIFFG